MLNNKMIYMNLHLYKYTLKLFFFKVTLTVAY